MKFKEDEMLAAPFRLSWWQRTCLWAVDEPFTAGITALAFVLCVALVLSSTCSCTPMQCKDTLIEINAHPGGKPRPAGLVQTKCDGKVVLEIVTDSVNP